LFGAVLSTPVGALIVSCEGSFCADAALTVMKSVAATNSDRVFIIRSPVPVPTDNIDEFARFHPQGARTGQPSKSQFPAWNFGTFQESIQQTSGG
jgi:hypothetical protein